MTAHYLLDTCAWLDFLLRRRSFLQKKVGCAAPPLECRLQPLPSVSSLQALPIPRARQRSRPSPPEPASRNLRRRCPVWG